MCMHLMVWATRSWPVLTRSCPARWFWRHVEHTLKMLHAVVAQASIDACWSGGVFDRPWCVRRVGTSTAASASASAAVAASSSSSSSSSQLQPAAAVAAEEGADLDMASAKVASFLSEQERDPEARATLAALLVLCATTALLVHAARCVKVLRPVCAPPLRCRRQADATAARAQDGAARGRRGSGTSASCTRAPCPRGRRPGARRRRAWRRVRSVRPWHGLRRLRPEGASLSTSAMPGTNTSTAPPPSEPDPPSRWWRSASLRLRAAELIVRGHVREPSGSKRMDLQRANCQSDAKANLKTHRAP